MRTVRSRGVRAATASVAAALIVTLASVASVATQEVHSAAIDTGQFMVPMAVGGQEAEEIEIREYQGERLGSVGDFRENSIKGVQYVDRTTYTLVLDGLVEHPKSWNYDELGEMNRLSKLVTIHCVEGWSVRALWDGIPLALLFAQVRPEADANTVVFHAADGYTTSLPLDFILDRNLIIADRINGIVLPPENGFPFELVAEDKWGYKWIKWIIRIELTDDPSYRGFWESRGYSNKGDLDGSKFGD